MATVLELHKWRMSFKQGEHWFYIQQELDSVLLSLWPSWQVWGCTRWLWSCATCSLFPPKVCSKGSQRHVLSWWQKTRIRRVAVHGIGLWRMNSQVQGSVLRKFTMLIQYFLCLCIVISKVDKCCTQYVNWGRSFCFFLWGLETLFSHVHNLAECLLGSLHSLIHMKQLANC